MPAKQWRIAIHDFNEAGAPEHVATAVREVRAHLSNLLAAAGHLITLDNADLIYELLGSPSAEGGEVTKLELDVRRGADTVGEGTHFIGEGREHSYRVAESQVRILGDYIERQNAEAEGSGGPRVFAAAKTNDSIGTMVKMPGGEYRRVSISGTQATIWAVDEENEEAVWRPVAVDISGILDEFERSDDYLVDSFVVQDGVGLRDFPAWLRQSLNERSTAAHAGVPEGVGGAGNAAISLVPRTTLSDAEAAQFSRSIEPFIGMVEMRLQDGSLGAYAEARARHELAAIHAEQHGNPAGPTPGVLRIHTAKLMEIVVPPEEAELVESGVSQDAAHELGAAMQAAVQLSEADDADSGAIAAEVVEHLAAAEHSSARKFWTGFKKAVETGAVGAVTLGGLFQFANLSPLLGAYIWLMLALLGLFVDRYMDHKEDVMSRKGFVI